MHSAKMTFLLSELTKCAFWVFFFYDIFSQTLTTACGDFEAASGSSV